DGEPVTATDLSVRAVVHVGPDEVLFTANPVDDATGQLVWRWSSGGVEPLTRGDGVHTASAGGRTLAIRSTSLDADGPVVTILTPPEDQPGGAPATAPTVRTIASFAAAPLVQPEVRLHHLGPRRIATAI